MSLRAGVLIFLLLYVVLGLVLEYGLRRQSRTAEHFLHSSRNLPLAITSLSFLAANCSALEVVSMVAISAKYGMVAVHFYWLGAIPALAFLLCVLLPRIREADLRSVPAYLERRYSRGARVVSALAFTALMIAVAGICLSLTARLLELTLGFSAALSIFCLALAVFCFLLLGGLGAVLYAEALQLIIFLLILLPLTLRMLHRAGGLRPVLEGLPATVQRPFSALPWVDPRASADLLGVMVGLGLVLSFTYWCADFLLIQRLYAARSFRSALHTPMLAICAKLFLPLLLVLPGLWIRTQHPAMLAAADYDLALPRLLLLSYTPLAAAAALAVTVTSLFLATCGNLAAGATILASDLLTTLGRPREGTSVSLSMSRLTTAVLVVSALPAAFLALHADARMEQIQLVLSAFNVPVGVVFILGVLLPRLHPRSGLPGILAGTGTGLLTWVLGHMGHLATGLSLSFYTAISSASCTVFTMFATSFRGWPAAGYHAPRSASGVSSTEGRTARFLALSCCCLMLLFYWLAER